MNDTEREIVVGLIEIAQSLLVMLPDTAPSWWVQVQQSKLEEMLELLEGEKVA